MVFRCNSLYFALLIIFMDGLLLDNDFRTRFSSFVFHLFVGVVVFGFAILLLPYFFLLFLISLLLLLLLSLLLPLLLLIIKYVLVFYGYVKLLVSPIIYVRDRCLPVYATFYYCFALDTTFLPFNTLT